MTPSIDIVIVNWNSRQQLMECVSSIRDHGDNFSGRCIIVDNGSTDGSTDFLEGASDVDLVKLGENLGFGRACNIGSARGKSSFILFLNPDARLMPGSIQNALMYMHADENANVGIVGVQLLGEDGQVQRSCAYSPTPGQLIAKSFGLTAFIKRWDMLMKTWDHATTRRVDQVIGAFFLVRRGLFESLHGFDERFFVYFEEVDLSLRAAQAGFISIYLADAQAFHKGGGVSEQVKAYRLFYSLRSRVQYAFKHFSPMPAVCVTCATLLIEPLSRSLFLTGTGRFEEIGEMFRGFWMLWKWVIRGPHE
jgi:GT2 family glycosyltransferase